MKKIQSKKISLLFFVSCIALFAQTAPNKPAPDKVPTFQQVQQQQQNTDSVPYGAIAVTKVEALQIDLLKKDLQIYQMQLTELQQKFIGLTGSILQAHNNPPGVTFNFQSLSFEKTPVAAPSSVKKEESKK